MDAQGAALHQQLTQVIATTYADWEVGPLTVAGSGLEFLVCRADSQRWGTLAIKTPWTRWIANDNDTHLDARDLLRQEATVSDYLVQSAVKVPPCYHLHLDDAGVDFLVSAFLTNDQSEPVMSDFGRLVRTLHQLAPPAISLVAQRETPLAWLLAERIDRRARVVEQLTSLQLPLLQADQLQASLAPVANRPAALLHMDARPANLLTRRGEILGIVDWSNALIGDPALELARIAESGYLTTAFLQGYGTPTPFQGLSPVIELIYRLDTAVMLGVVFLSEAPDAQLGAAQVARIQTLYHEFVAQSPTAERSR
ncbi:MAG: phosphotransferase [Caldilineaceae bacterium]|nr:phosphotransferase [Caldilineaceae bacterium]